MGSPQCFFEVNRYHTGPYMDVSGTKKFQWIKEKYRNDFVYDYIKDYALGHDYNSELFCFMFLYSFKLKVKIIFK